MKQLWRVVLMEITLADPHRKNQHQTVSLEELVIIDLKTGIQGKKCEKAICTKVFVVVFWIHANSFPLSLRVTVISL